MKERNERKEREREGLSIIANKYLALNIILERNQNATVISTKPHEISYANMHGIYLANSSEKNLFQNEREKSVFFCMKIRRYVRVLSERCRTFKDLWILRMRLQIGIKHTVKIYSPFLTIYSDFFFKLCNNVICYSANNTKGVSTPSKPIKDAFYALLWPFFLTHIINSKRQKKKWIFFSPGHWLKYKSFKRNLCDENHNGFNHKILKWQHNRIKSWKKYHNQLE